jgi:hypothetical protein
MPDLMERVAPVIEDARAMVVATKDDVEAARGKGKIINALISEVESTFRPIKQAQDAAKKITLEQEKKHLAPLQEAKGIIAGKITLWDEQERRRIEEEQRAISREQERVRQLALNAAQRKLGELSAKMATDQEYKAALEAKLSDPATTDEEAEVFRAELRTVEARMHTTVERAAEVEQKVEEVSQPIAPVQSAASVKTATGVSQTKEVTGVNLKVFLRWLASDECTVDPSSVIKVQDGPIKSLVQKMTLPGVSWRWTSRTRF